MKMFAIIIIISLTISVTGCVNTSNIESTTSNPYSTLSPPSDITPAKTLYNDGWVSSPPISPEQRSDKDFIQLEKKLS